MTVNTNIASTSRKFIDQAPVTPSLASSRQQQENQQENKSKNSSSSSSLLRTKVNLRSNVTPTSITNTRHDVLTTPQLQNAQTVRSPNQNANNNNTNQIIQHQSSEATLIQSDLTSVADQSQSSNTSPHSLPHLISAIEWRQLKSI
jgi:hypothetical protein